MASIIKLELKTHKKQVPDSNHLKVDLGLDTLALRLAGNRNTEATLSHLAHSLLYQVGTLPPNDKKFSKLRDSQVTNFEFPEFISLPLL